MYQRLLFFSAVKRCAQYSYVFLTNINKQNIRNPHQKCLVTMFCVYIITDRDKGIKREREDGSAHVWESVRKPRSETETWASWRFILVIIPPALDLDWWPYWYKMFSDQGQHMSAVNTHWLGARLSVYTQKVITRILIVLWFLSRCSSEHKTAVTCHMAPNQHSNTFYCSSLRRLMFDFPFL